MVDDTLVKDLLNLKLPQPTADVGSLCTVAVIFSPFAPLNWAKVPCDYPIFRAGLICEKPAAVDKLEGMVIYFNKLIKHSNIEMSRFISEKYMKSVE